MKTILYCVVLLSCLLMGCAGKETPGGVKYKVIKKGDGKELPFGKYMVLNLQLKDSKDSVWFSTQTMGNPVVMGVPDASMVNDEGEYGVFKALSIGDSVTFQLTANTVFFKTRKSPVPKNVNPQSFFTFNVGVVNAWSEEEVNAFQEKITVQNEVAQIKKDSTIINNYLKEKGIVAKSTPDGIYYEVKKEGKGELVPEGKTAYVHYAGYLLNGQMFDTSMSSAAAANNFDNGGNTEPYAVVVNTGSVISGWDKMLMLMNKGMKVTVYIPSGFAYKAAGNGPRIPPNSVLMFDMEVVDIK